MRWMSLFVICAVLVLSCFAQQESDQTLPYPLNPQPNFFESGLGMTWINGISYMTVSLNPEFSFGKFGVGLRIDLLFNTQDNFNRQNSRKI